LVVQLNPAVHATHPPLPSHTRLLPQLAPGAASFGPSRQVEVPVPHAVTPCLHGVGLVEHAVPALHGTHTPIASQTCPPPHEVPTAALSPSAQPPVVHDTMPSLQGAPGFELHELALPH
jgi:hypothetical protein